MNYHNWRSWRIIAKLDPDKEVSDPGLQTILKSGVATVIVGGTQNITLQNTLLLIERIKACGFTGNLIQEISHIEAIAPNAGGYAIPFVLNAGSLEWLVTNHIEAIKKYNGLIDWNTVIPFAYLICNPESAVARYTGAKPTDIDDAVAYTILAQRLFGVSAIYIEYSGSYGDPELVAAVARARTQAKLIYGGGISSVEQALEMLQYADSVVVGNALYDKPELLTAIINRLSR